MKVVITYLILSFLSIGYGFSQVPNDLNLKLSDDDIKKLEKTAEGFDEARKLYDRGVQIFKSLPASDSLLKYDKDYQKKYEEAVDQIKKGSQLYHESTIIYYSIYKKGADNFWEEQKKAGHYAIGLEKAKYLESIARKYFTEAKMNRNLVLETYMFEEALKYLNKANHNEILAIREQGRALQIYQDFPVEYDYQWEEDIDIEEILAQKEAERQARNEKLFGAKKPEKEENPIVLPREEEKPDQPYIGEIIYRVQIAAAKTPITDEYIKTIYRGDREVIEVKEDEWFKYQINKRFQNFSDALDELKATKVNRAFIVAYQDGVRISVQRARELSP